MNLDVSTRINSKSIWKIKQQNALFQLKSLLKANLDELDWLDKLINVATKENIFQLNKLNES